MEIYQPKTTSELWGLLDEVTDIVTGIIRDSNSIKEDGPYNNTDIASVASILAERLEALATIRTAMLCALPEKPNN